MDRSLLARRLWELNAWIEEQEGAGGERQTFGAPPYGDARITLDPRTSSPAASFNPNRISLCGSAGGLTERGLRELVARFSDRDIPRVFIWLSPGPDIDQVREWIGALHGVRVRWTRYPALMLTGPAEPARGVSLDIRQVDVAGFTADRIALGDAVFEGYARTLQKPGFHHFIAYDAERAIAAAALVVQGDLGYLTYAGTVESARGRGAQSALIAHRVAVARALGCSHIVSQTLSMLAQSLANLQRAGFREMYETEVYELPLGGAGSRIP